MMAASGGTLWPLGRVDDGMNRGSVVRLNDTRRSYDAVGGSVSFASIHDQTRQLALKINVLINNTLCDLKVRPKGSNGTVK